MRIDRVVIVIGFCAVIGTGSPGTEAHGGIVALSQSRTIGAVGNVSSEGGGDADWEYSSAAGFNLFDDAVGVALNYYDPVYPIGGNVNGIASQKSWITTTEIGGALLADASAGVFDYEFFSATAGAAMESRFAVSFRIDAAGEYHLTTSGPLVFDFGEVLFQFWHGTDLLAETFNGGETLDLHFDLAPGEYEIISYATAYPFASADGFQAGRAEFDFKLSATTAVPEPQSLVLLCCGIPALLMCCRRLPE